jgi:hypothetical protein
MCWILLINSKSRVSLYQQLFEDQKKYGGEILFRVIKNIVYKHALQIVEQCSCIKKEMC